MNKAFLQKIQEYTAVALTAVCLYPAVLKCANAFFVDLRFQTISSYPRYAWSSLAVSAGLTLLYAALSRELSRKAGRTVRDHLLANLPLAGCAVLWFYPLTFPLLPAVIFLIAASAGRTAALCKYDALPEFEGRKAFLLLAGISFLYASYGAYEQIRSLETLAMSWFDWGHFFECLNNFFHGKPFYLNLNNGNFLGSRFTPSLMLLLPVVATGSVPLFLFTGSLLTSSGALFVYLISRNLKGSVAGSFLLGLWYLLIPGVANMNLPLIDGFHEVFLLYPLFLGAVLCVIKKWYIPAGILFILALGVRETAGVIFAGYGIVLFLQGRKKQGGLLFLLSILYCFAAIKLLMPLFDPPVQGTYAHVGFYSHLGKDIAEIALSPLTRPGIFFPALFNGHNLLFWVTLFLPFLFLAFLSPLYLLPLLPELVMLSLDRRFDTQTVLRHYQISLLLVLIAASLAGIKKLREGKSPAVVRKMFFPFEDADILKGAAAASFTAAALCFFMFVQIPFFPCADPQRRYTETPGIPRWENAMPAMKQIRALIPPGAKVTAGPRPASLLIPDYDIYFDFSCDDSKPGDYVLIENFFSFYFPEDRLSRYLLISPNWELIYQTFVDERSLQLFRRSPVKLVKKRPPVLPEAVWQKTGTPIPVPAQGLELRGAVPSPGKLRITVRLKEKRKNDAGFRVQLSFASGSTSRYFTSFCNGRFPADLARPGEAFFFEVAYPETERLTGCQVDVVELSGGQAPQ